MVKAVSRAVTTMFTNLPRSRRLVRRSKQRKPFLRRLFNIHLANILISARQIAREGGGGIIHDSRPSRPGQSCNTACNLYIMHDVHIEMCGIFVCAAGPNRSYKHRRRQSSSNQPLVCRKVSYDMYRTKEAYNCRLKDTLSWLLSARELRELLYMREGADNSGDTRTRPYRSFEQRPIGRP